MKVPRRLRNLKTFSWGARILLSALAGTVGYIATTGSIAVALPDSQVETAHKLAPYNAGITAKLARIRMLADPRLAHRMSEERLATAALSSNLAAIPAITTLGVIDQLRGENANARHLFYYSNFLSRRDLVTQIWLIEDAVSRGNAADAIHHYDIALRTKESSRDVFFPILAAASNDQVIATALVQTFNTNPAPAWKDAFLWFTAGNSGNPIATARLFADLRRQKIPITQAANSALINALISNNQLDAAWSYYALVNQGVVRLHIRDPEFKKAVDVPSFFDWVPANDETGISAIIQSGALDFSVPPSTGGEIIKQMQVLPAGNYILEGHDLNVAQTTGSLPYWVLICAANGQELGRVSLTNSNSNEGFFKGRFVVPPGCSAQYLALIARPSDSIAGSTGQIDRVKLSPAE